MKKKYHMNQKGKERLALIIWSTFIIIGMLVAIHIYTERIEDINNGNMTLVSDSECDK